jgi:MFS family permease
MCLITGIALLAWISVRTRADMYVWVVFYGLAAGAIQSLFPAGLSSLTTDLRKRGTRMGMTFTIVSFAVLTGNPIAGQIIARLDGEYWGAQVFTGISILVGSGFIIAARVAKQRRLGSGWRTKV